MKWRETHGIRETHGRASLLIIAAIIVTGCRTQQQTVETHSRASLAQYDSLRITDLSVIHDTIAVFRTETLWREPDSLGNIYPLMTVNEERAAWRETENNIVGTRVDTVYIVNHRDNHRDGSSIDEVNQRTVPAIDLKDARPCVSTNSPAWKVVGWVIFIVVILIISVVTAISVKILRV